MQDQQGPDAVIDKSFTLLERLQQAVYIARVHHAHFPDYVFIQILPEQGLQFSVQPLGKWNGEAPFRTFEDWPGYEVIKHALHEVLGAPSFPHLKVEWQVKAEFNQLLVQQRNTRLQRV